MSKVANEITAARRTFRDLTEEWIRATSITGGPLVITKEAFYSLFAEWLETNEGVDWKVKLLHVYPIPVWSHMIDQEFPSLRRTRKGKHKMRRDRFFINQHLEPANVIRIRETACPACGNKYRTYREEPTITIEELKATRDDIVRLEGEKRRAQQDAAPEISDLVRARDLKAEFTDPAICDILLRWAKTKRLLP